MAVVESEAREAMDDNVHALVPAREESPIALGALQAGDARELVAKATEIANELASVIRDQNLFVKIQGRDHVVVEGWTTLGAMLSVLPYEIGVEFDPETGIFIAEVELRRMSDQAPLSKASAECGGDDDWVGKPGGKTWNSRPRYARRSMAITRATSKVCRLAFSWVMTLAGYATTPAEEMPRDEPAPAVTVPALSAQETVMVHEARMRGTDSLTELSVLWQDAQRAARATGDKSVMADLLEIKDACKERFETVIEGEATEARS